MTLKTRICGTNTIINDINGPPKVEENNKSTPGPILAKNGMYSNKMMKIIPPAIHKAYFHQTFMKFLNPGSVVPCTLPIAKILELFKTKNTKNIGK